MPRDPDYSIQGPQRLRYNPAQAIHQLLRVPVYLLQDADDAALVSRSLAGDATAFETLVSRHQRALFTVAIECLATRGCRRCVAERADQGLRTPASFDPRHRFFSWIYRIVVNECLNMLRARRPEDVLNPALAAVGRRSSRRRPPSGPRRSSRR